jgi:tetratricopeptide (TPR) repeat protein
MTMPEPDGDDAWPDREVMIVQTGDAAAARGDVARARTFYQLAIDSGHPYWAPHAADRLGALFAAQGDVAGARAYYQLAIDSGHAEVAPRSAANLGILLAGQGDVAGARAAYQLATDSGHPDVGPAAAARLASLTWPAADDGTAGSGTGERGSPLTLTNRERVGRGLEFLASGLGPYVHARLVAVSPGGPPWTEVLAARDRARGLAERRYSLSDPRLLLRVMIEEWSAFKDQLSAVERGFAVELRDTGNKWAHGDAISAADAYRALDTMERLLNAIGAAMQASQVRSVRADLSEFGLSREGQREGQQEGQREGQQEGQREGQREGQTVASDDYAARYEACRQRAIAAGALKPQSFSERAINGMRYGGGPTYAGQPVMDYSQTRYAQRRLEMWIDDCLNGRPFTKMKPQP